jgi:hypothetical protein
VQEIVGKIQGYKIGEQELQLDIVAVEDSEAYYGAFE